MSFLNLSLIVFLGILFFVLYFHISNFILDKYNQKSKHRQKFENSIRVIIFILPAFIVLFIFILYPVFETIRLSFYDKFGREFVGLYNYQWAINDPEFKRSILNNLGWLLIVPTLSTFFGLVIANLTDRIWWGSIAKSIVFMPMAISAVGASAIFKFIYEYRPPPLTQIGIINGIRVSVDRGQALPGVEPGEKCMNNRVINGELKDFKNEDCLNPIGWLQQRDLTNLPFTENLNPEGFLSGILLNLPINTMLLMVIMIWMFTGFAAVVFSAGIKAIPAEIMEAGQIDGASELRVFRSIVIPYIKSTIIVVGTYMVVTVLKAFDIIYVSTRGDLETNLLAVKMLDEFSKYRNFGRSATVAVLIFVCVLPIIVGTAIRERENTQS